jgi:hypothetical protein
LTSTIAAELPSFRASGGAFESLLRYMIA